MVDAGTFLAHATCSGSGTTLQVDDARYFYDGYGLEGVTGDLIQLEGQTQTATVVGINYDTHTLTLDRSLFWSAGQGVSLAFQGTAPDIGVYEFAPELMLHGAPAARAIRLDWTVTGALPVTATWCISYYSQTVASTVIATDSLTNTARAYTLTDLTNYAWYTVTLNAMLDSAPFLTDTVRIMPTDIFVYMPLVMRGQ
jgi:hypothetical protein